MSQAQELLRVLDHGGWVSTQELLREVPCIVHSRISDLRAQGHTIEHRTVGVGAAGSQYRLVKPRLTPPPYTWSLSDYLKGAA